MKFSIDRLTFCEAVTNISHAVANRSTLPVLEGILLNVSENELSLSSYNFSMGMKKSIPVKNCEEEGKIVINARLLLEMIRRLSGETVNITVNNRNLCKIESNSAEYEIIGYDAAEFPEIPEVDSPVFVSIPGDTLKEMVKQTIFAASSNENALRPILLGLYFELDESICKITAIDGHKMAHREENVKGNEAINFVAPAKAIGEAVKLINEDNKIVVLEVGSKYISLTINGYNIITRLMEGEFLEYEQIIPKENKTSIKISTKEIINILERMSLLINDAIKTPVKVSIKSNEIIFSCATALGKATENYLTDIESEEYEVGFNAQYLVESLKATESDEVIIHFNGSRNPILITPTAESDAFKYIVMPMQLRESDK